ncbi:MAG: hypothetical protein AB1589_13225 [Cyanobacteriota bacterium]
MKLTCLCCQPLFWNSRVKLFARRVQLAETREAMVRAIEKIEQDLAALEDAIALLRAEFDKGYSHYLKLLGQAMRRQLIQVSYQVCTQGYPDAFLSLSFNERQKLQQAIQQMGKQAQEKLLSSLEPSENETQTEASDSVEPTFEQLPVSNEYSEEQTQQQLPELVPTPESLEVKETTQMSKTLPTQLDQLLQWQEKIEAAIAKTLQTLSLNTNSLLQQSGVIPNKLPAAVLEAAAKADAATESATVGAPNLLNLLMETESEDDSEDSTLTRIMAINLRLSEIEFADPALSAARNQLRNLSAKTNTLQRQYLKKQRERAVAQAEAAWRSSWYEE